MSIVVRNYRRQRLILLQACRALRSGKRESSSEWMHMSVDAGVRAVQRDMVSLRHVLKAVL